jgi:signal transduction histidine kinase
MLQNAQVLENRFRDDLPANVEAAQEAGTTMAAIRAYLEKRRILQMIEMIRQSGERATDIVRNMLNFTRKNSSSSSSNDVAALIEETLALMKNDYDLKNDYDFRKIAIERDYAPGLPLILCERSRIQQVLFNVFKNGAQAMAEQRLVTGSRAPTKFIIRVHVRDGMLEIDISDNGPGMDEHIAKRVFEPFFTTKEVGVGTGLGLAVSYFIITETHRGEMRVESRPGEGTTVIIRLPLPDGAPTSM